MNALTKKILIIAGETSGDKHAADLVAALKQNHPQLKFAGIGGDQMAEQGVQLLYHISQIAVLGFVEVIKHLPQLRQIFGSIKKYLKEQRPAAVILVDYPGFNLRVAKIAKEFAIPVIYYICPQLWAWGENRVETIRKYVDLPLVIFRFEEEFFARHGITAHFVGHPLIDQIRLIDDRQAFCKEHGLPEEKPILGLLPGSREMEIRRLLPVMLEVSRKLQKDVAVTPVIAKAWHLPEKLYGEFIKKENVFLLKKDIHSLMYHSHAALAASGTATLELGYLGTPLVVLYSVSPFTYWIGRYLVKLQNIALVNIILGERVAPEYIQKNLNATRITPDLRLFFTDPRYYQIIRQKLQNIREILGPPGASGRAAEKVLRFLRERGEGHQL